MTDGNLKPMDSLRLYAQSEPLCGARCRRFQAAALLILAAVVVGCASPRVCTTRTEIQRIPNPIIIPVPDEFVEPLPIAELPANLSNRDLEADIDALEDVIDRCQYDREQIRNRQNQGGALNE